MRPGFQKRSTLKDDGRINPESEAIRQTKFNETRLSEAKHTERRWSNECRERSDSADQRPNPKDQTPKTQPPNPMPLLQSLLSRLPHWQIAQQAIQQNTTPEQTAIQTQQHIQQQYDNYLYNNKLPDDYKLETLTNFFYDLMTIADLLTENQQPFHALAIITTSLSHLPEIDEYTLSEIEVPHLIEHFGYSLRKTLSQSPPDQSQQILNNYNTFLTTLAPNNLYLDELHHLPLSPI